MNFLPLNWNKNQKINCSKCLSAQNTYHLDWLVTTKKNGNRERCIVVSIDCKLLASYRLKLVTTDIWQHTLTSTTLLAFNSFKILFSKPKSFISNENNERAMMLFSQIFSSFSFSFCNFLLFFIVSHYFCIWKINMKFH